MSIASLTPQQIAIAETHASEEGYFHRVLVGFDQFWNVTLGGRPDMTISARAYLDAQKHDVLAEVLNHALNVIQKNHGQKASAGDEERTDVAQQALAPALEAPPSDY